MKTVLIIILFSLFPILGKTQVNANKIVVSGSGFTVKNHYITTIQGAYPKSDSSTQAASFFLSTDSNIIVNNGSISFHSSGGYHAPYGITEWSYNLDIMIDTNLKKINSMNAQYTSRLYYDTLDRSYWDEVHQNLSLQNIPYVISFSKDTLSVFLDTTTFDKFSFGITNYKISATLFTYTNWTGSDVLKIDSNANISLKIIGRFPLSVALNSSALKRENIFIVPNLKILKIMSTLPQPLPCYDLLGRKHILEFLGTDGAASTYSVRSLRPGVYFMSDGKEMVKFIIGE